MKAIDPRYDYYISVSAHIILRDGGKILLQKRPLSWEWAPGRWCLPGGRPCKNETFEHMLVRKTKQELGFVVDSYKIFSIRQVLMQEKQAFMFFYTADYKGQEVGGEMDEYRWFSESEIENIPTEKMAEYFFKDMFLDFFKKPGQEVIVKTLDYAKMDKISEFKKWRVGVVNKNYDPEKLADFKKWKDLNSNKK